MLVFILKICFEYPGKSMKCKTDWITCMGRNFLKCWEKLKAMIIGDSCLLKKIKYCPIKKL